MTWRCAECSEQHEDSFDACWNCGHSRDGTLDEPFERATDAPVRARFVDAIVEHAGELGRGMSPPKEKRFERRLQQLEAEVASLRSEIRSLRHKKDST